MSKLSRLVGIAVCSSLLVASAAHAGPPIIATSVVGVCLPQPFVRMTLDPLTHKFYAIDHPNSLYYHFDPPSPGKLAGSDAAKVDLLIPSGFAVGSTHEVWISTSAQPTGGSSSKVYSFTVPSCEPAELKRGLTWTLITPPSQAGTVRVGCNNGCDPHKGDTVCGEALPILCIRKSGPGFPVPKPASIDGSSQYNRWSGGVVATTAATVPPTKLADADALCVQQFGTGWRVAEFHDGWGWAFQAYGGVGDPSKRFWVDINDQPGATCWTK